jgi:hypothetical protein
MQLLRKRRIEVTTESGSISLLPRPVSVYIKRTRLFLVAIVEAYAIECRKDLRRSMTYTRVS